MSEKVEIECPPSGPLKWAYRVLTDPAMLDDRDVVLPIRVNAHYIWIGSDHVLSVVTTKSGQKVIGVSHWKNAPKAMREELIDILRNGRIEYMEVADFQTV